MLILLARSVMFFERGLRPARAERGTSLVEYVLLLSLLTLVCFAAMHFFGGALNSRYTSAASSIG